MKKWAFIIDVAKCEDCNNCFLACKDEHVGNDWPGYSAAQPVHGQRWINLMRKERGQYPLIDVAYRPTPCMHCERPPCIEQAQNGAVYKRDDGIVLIDPAKSAGQRELVKACPYGAIWWNQVLEIPQKCTLCAHLLDEGWQKPRCVQACPTGAIRVIKLEDADLSRLAAEHNLQQLHPEYGTGPRVYYKNLQRYDKCFIGGSVAYEIDGLTECAQGVRVTLYQESNALAVMHTSRYGDFMFDGLSQNSGPYRVSLEFEGFETRELDAKLGVSLNLGVIMLLHASTG